jgi:hypothetical protein
MFNMLVRCFTFMKLKCRNDAVTSPNNDELTRIALVRKHLQALCPGILEPTDMITFCTTVAVCGNLPTVGFMLSGELVSCVLGNGASGVATGGITVAISKTIELGLNQVGFGFALGASFAYGVTVWDGDDLVSATVAGK